MVSRVDQCSVKDGEVIGDGPAGQWLAGLISAVLRMARGEVIGDGPAGQWSAGLISAVLRMARGEVIGDGPAG